eukprot:gb/GFBE01005870.1/.p1 GENE.gb/GFBE01005870.1/~~gb/GFBE01005870.1/.p1  ORF type:complete len:155 (+),score=15.12 gb/GFBE01005870.1/:1-465(+)
MTGSDAGGGDPAEPLLGNGQASSGWSTYEYVGIGSCVLLWALAWPLAILLTPGIAMIFAARRIYFTPDHEGVARKDTDRTEALVVMVIMSLAWTAFFVLFRLLLYPDYFCPSKENLPCKVTSWFLWIGDMIYYISCRMSGDGGRNTDEYCSRGM